MKKTRLEKDVERMVNEVLVDFFEIDSAALQRDSHIFNDLGLDSLDIVDLVAALQAKFGVKIQSAEQVKNIRTLNDIYEFVVSVKTVM